MNVEQLAEFNKLLGFFGDSKDGHMNLERYLRQ